MKDVTETLLDLAVEEILAAKARGESRQLEFMDHILSTETITNVSDAYMQIYGKPREEVISEFRFANLLANAIPGDNSASLEQGMEVEQTRIK